jgi:hypothetical protein
MRHRTSLFFYISDFFGDTESVLGAYKHKSAFTWYIKLNNIKI